MLLAYYRGLYLDDTKVLIELTREDFNMKCTCDHICSSECKVDVNNIITSDVPNFCDKYCESCEKWMALFKDGLPRICSKAICRRRQTNQRALPSLLRDDF